MAQPFFSHQPEPGRIRALMETYPSWLECDLDNLAFNLEQIRKRVGVDVMPVVKNNAYGHGLMPITEFLVEQGVQWFLVAKLHEAERIRSACPGSKVLNMDTLFGRRSHERVVQAGITQAVFTHEMAQTLSDTGAALGLKASVFIKVDTGLRRVGVHHEQAADFVEQVVALPNVELAGLFSSFMQHPEEDQRMLVRFRDVAAEVERRGIHVPLRTMASTNAIFHQPEAWLDIVRPAMCLFGVRPFAADQDVDVPLKQVIALKARLELVKPVRSGDSVTYFRTFTAPHPMRIGTLHIGFYDALPRELANKLRVKVGDTFKQGVGTIALNHCLVDVTDTDADVGDVVTVFGRDGENTLLEMASAAGWMVYSLLNHLNPLMPRVYFRGGEPVGVLDSTTEL